MRFVRRGIHLLMVFVFCAMLRIVRVVRPVEFVVFVRATIPLQAITPAKFPAQSQDAYSATPQTHAHCVSQQSQ